MMKTPKYLFGYIIAALFITGCSNNENFYQPGPDVNPNSPKVYFNASNPGVGNVDTGDQYLNIAVSRINTSGSITVPITVTWHSEGLTFPDQGVTFAAGEETAYFRVGYSNDLTYETPYPFGLAIEHSYTDPYDSSIPGTVTFKGNLNRVEPWVLVANTTCTFQGTSGSNLAKFDNFTQALYKKELAGIFKFENWCLNGTGEPYGDLIFSVRNNQMYPDPSVGYHGESGRWYFYVPWATSDDTSFQINGKLPTSTGVYMTYFYLYTVGSTDSRFAMDFNEQAKTARLGGYSRYSSSTFSSGAFMLHYTW